MVNESTGNRSKTADSNPTKKTLGQYMNAIKKKNQYSQENEDDDGIKSDDEPSSCGKSFSQDELSEDELNAI